MLRGSKKLMMASRLGSRVLSPLRTRSHVGLGITGSEEIATAIQVGWEIIFSKLPTVPV